MLTLGVLASHRGSNLQAILDACATGHLQARVALVVSNNSRAEALARARAAGVPTIHLSSATHPAASDLDRALTAAFVNAGAQWLVTAGYMKKLGPHLLRRYADHIVNIHPSLLPAYGGPGMYGERVHAAVLAAGDPHSGATVHLVNGEYDAGRILAQQRVPVYPGDDPGSLAGRVLVAEHALLVATLEQLSEGNLPPGPKEGTR